MNYNFIIVLIIILFLFILFNKYLNIQLYEYFSEPFPIGFCSINTKLGIRYSNQDCIPLNEDKKTNTNKDFKKNNSKPNTPSQPRNEPVNSNTFSSTNPINRTLEDQIKDINTCFPDESDFGKICKIRHNSNQYGLKKLKNCYDKKKKIIDGITKVECGKLFFNKEDYSTNPDNKYSTPCINASLDLNTMCNSYIPDQFKINSYKQGYNSDSAGSNIKLLGKSGDCYTNNLPDDSKARVICGFKKFNQIDRVRPFSYENDYNKFTECNKTTHDFVNDCKNILVKTNENIIDENIFADIKGFDCMPGFARAKCIDKTNNIDIPDNLQKFMTDSKSDIYSNVNFRNNDDDDDDDDT